ncbi:hypothetical protein PV721_22290 [Streptomyces sp. MB09-01]|uniref:hypothetical protein n=1 Tax=Streptomyces sp. MB09-01 TaxID=3028666 RepID=UPI0029B17CDC|nr:hypothetical protein [Streptomyces sp. MB09-01]MDX3537054.1 hypothetical protein [Streptomyces sp. MB09-01]
MNRRTRLLLVTPLAAASLVAAPTALAVAPSAAPAAVPAATCSVSGVLGNGKVHLSGGGFTPGPAYVYGSAGFGGTVEISENGGFQIMNVAPGQYSVRQGGELTQCSI